jgi:hypothetical protein
MRNTERCMAVAYDSPEGSRDLTNPTKRGAFIGEKYVLALCSKASISTTTGQVTFNEHGRKRDDKIRRMAGSKFQGHLSLTVAEWEEMCEAAKRLIPPVPTFFNGIEIPDRKPLREWRTTLETVKGDAEGNLRRTERLTTVSAYPLLDGETALLYEMGIPVVELNAKYHCSIAQKVPLNVDRDNVKPSYLKAIYVELLNNTKDLIDESDANANWVRTAASDPRCESEAIKTVLDLRFGPDRVSYDMNDVGSNREAASKNFTVITGGSLSRGEWENAKKADAIKPAGEMFPTNLPGGTPSKVYDSSEWTPEMAEYAALVEAVSPHLVGRKVGVEYYRDRKFPVCGSFHVTHFSVNLAYHKVGDWQGNLELMYHELAHDTVRSNDHLIKDFYDTQGRIAAKCTLLAVEHPELFACVRRARVNDKTRTWPVGTKWPDDETARQVGVAVMSKVSK